jgi:predicted nucleic acid-binding Zn ribbon protein
MAKRQGDHKPIGNVLSDFIKSNRLQEGLDKVSVNEAWAKVMGKAIMKYTSAVQLEGNTLYVQLRSSVLREELSYGREKIIDMINEELGKDLVEKLVLR